MDPSLPTLPLFGNTEDQQTTPIIPQSIDSQTLSIPSGVYESFPDNPEFTASNSTTSELLGLSSVTQSATTSASITPWASDAEEDFRDRSRADSAMRFAQQAVLTMEQATSLPSSENMTEEERHNLKYAHKCRII